MLGTLRVRLSVLAVAGMGAAVAAVTVGAGPATAGLTVGYTLTVIPVTGPPGTAIELDGDPLAQGALQGRPAATCPDSNVTITGSYATTGGGDGQQQLETTTDPDSGIFSVKTTVPDDATPGQDVTYFANIDCGDGFNVGTNSATFAVTLPVKPSPTPTATKTPGPTPSPTPAATTPAATPAPVVEGTAHFTG